MVFSSSELKRESRGLLTGKYGVFTGALVLILLFSYFSGILTDYISVSTHSTFMVFAAGIILLLFRFLMNAGISLMCLQNARLQQVKTGGLFAVFSIHPDKLILITLYTILMIFVCLIPLITTWVISFGRLPVETRSETTVLFLLLAAFIVSIVLLFYVLAGISQVYYLFFDKPNRSVPDLIRESRSLMSANRLRWVKLQLSFAGMILLCALTFGLGLLWVIPYIRMTNTLFYLSLHGETAGPEGFGGEE